MAQKTEPATGANQKERFFEEMAEDVINDPNQSINSINSAGGSIRKFRSGEGAGRSKSGRT